MKRSLSTVLIVAMGLFVCNALSAQKVMPTDCVSFLSFEDSAIKSKILWHLRNIGDDEIPIVAVQKIGDTTHYFISAYVWTNSIKKNPPSSIVNFAGREALLYTGKESITRIQPACFKYLLEKYSRILGVDKIIRRDKLSLDKSPGFTYDPISADIMVSTDGHVTSRNRRFPFLRIE